MKIIKKRCEEIDSFALLESINIETADCEELRKLCAHLRTQFKTRYKYLVGEWSSARRAKSTVDGKFVSQDEVVEYLKNQT